MPKRTQVSIKGETYTRLKEYCDKHGLEISKLVDLICTEFFEPHIVVTGNKPRKKLDYRDIKF